MEGTKGQYGTYDFGAVVMAIDGGLGLGGETPDGTFSNYNLWYSSSDAMYEAEKGIASLFTDLDQAITTHITPNWTGPAKKSFDLITTGVLEYISDLSDRLTTPISYSQIMYNGGWYLWWAVSQLAELASLNMQYKTTPSESLSPDLPAYEGTPSTEKDWTTLNEAVVTPVARVYAQNLHNGYLELNNYIRPVPDKPTFDAPNQTLPVPKQPRPPEIPKPPKQEKLKIPQPKINIPEPKDIKTPKAPDLENPNLNNLENPNLNNLQNPNLNNLETPPSPDLGTVEPGGPGGNLLGPGGALLGPDGKPLLGPDGKPITANDIRGVGPNGELLGPDGKPLLGPDGKPLTLNRPDSAAGRPLLPGIPTGPGPNLKPNKLTSPRLKPVTGAGLGKFRAPAPGSLVSPRLGTGGGAGPLGKLGAGAKGLGELTTPPVARSNLRSTSPPRTPGLPGAGAGGGMYPPPMGGAGAAPQGGKDQERERTTWLVEDDEVWGAAPDTAPPSLGRTAET